MRSARSQPAVSSSRRIGEAAGADIGAAEDIGHVRHVVVEAIGASAAQCAFQQRDRGGDPAVLQQQVAFVHVDQQPVEGLAVPAGDAARLLDRLEPGGDRAGLSAELREEAAMHHRRQHEGGGAAALPRLARRLAERLLEHPQLLGQVAGIPHRLGQPEGGADDPDGIRRRQHDVERLAAELLGAGQVAAMRKGGRAVDVDPGERQRVAGLPGKHIGFVQVVLHPREVVRGAEHEAQPQPHIDAEAHALGRHRLLLQGGKDGFQMDPGLGPGRTPGGALAGLQRVAHRLRPGLGGDGVARQILDARLVGRGLQDMQDARVQPATLAAQGKLSCAITWISTCEKR
ncbi:hypothetical protein [Dankookia sp. P2]|uniref:hypothetical protein n=1 Tax=Dankookia sp. P2 TaxID=3423955 RepID=UPI003D67D46A